MAPPAHFHPPQASPFPPTDRQKNHRHLDRHRTSCRRLPCCQLTAGTDRNSVQRHSHIRHCHRSPATSPFEKSVRLPARNLSGALPLNLLRHSPLSPLSPSDRPHPSLSNCLRRRHALQKIPHGPRIAAHRQFRVGAQTHSPPICSFVCSTRHITPAVFI